MRLDEPPTYKSANAIRKNSVLEFLMPNALHLFNYSHSFSRRSVSDFLPLHFPKHIYLTIVYRSLRLVPLACAITLFSLNIRVIFSASSFTFTFHASFKIIK